MLIINIIVKSVNMLKACKKYKQAADVSLISTYHSYTFLYVKWRKSFVFCGTSHLILKSKVYKYLS